jgi:hypothetical protein
MNTIVDVLNDIGGGKTSDLVAKIVGEKGKTFTVRYLSPTKKMHGDQVVYKYEDTTYDIDKDCVSGYYDSTNEEDAGFTLIEEGCWVQSGEDSDYTPSEEQDSTSEEESLVESEED